MRGGLAMKSVLVRAMVLGLIAAFFVSCGGGGDDSGGGGTPAPTLPTLINYEVSPSNLSPSTPLISAVLPGGVAFSMFGFSLSGTIERRTNDSVITLDDYINPTTRNGMGFTLPPVTDRWSSVATVQITVAEGGTITWVSGEDPTSGSFLVSTDAFGNGAPTYAVVFNSGGTGVDIYDTDPYGQLDNLLSSLTWDEFKNALNNSSAQTYEVLLSMAYNRLQTVFRYVSQAYTLLSIVVENDALIQSQHLVDLGGDNFPGVGAATITVEWLDQDQNSEINPGDGFMFTFSNWWDDVSEYIYNGHLCMLEYWEGQDSTLGTYVGGNFRFGPDSGPSDFTEQKTVNETISDDTAIVSNGFFFLAHW
jgi:hypothetical protein